MTIDKAPLTKKYRPLNFKDVVGQETAIIILKSILKKGDFFSPFMFTGIYGGGKTTLARILARAILCEAITEDCEPCNRCASCISFLKNANLSYEEIDAASNSGVDKIRQLRDSSYYKSLGMSDKKVVVIDECHSISSQGNEALLKQLEDNDGRQIYIFCTTSPEKMLDTVRSRCFEFSIQQVSPEVIAGHLKYICEQERITHDQDSLQIISEQCFPHIRDCIKELDYLSNLGKVTKEITFDYFKINTRTDYLKIIYNLKFNIKEAISLLKKTSISNDPTKIYQGLISVSIDILKFNLGMDNFKTKEQKALAIKIFNNYSHNMPTILTYFLSRNKYSDYLTLESDLFILSSNLNSTYLSNPLPPPSPIIDEIETVEITVEPPTEHLIEETIISNKESIEDLDDTAKVLKRYKSYPEHLALLMDKGKKCSSIKSVSTVELKQKVKDFKRNLDRDEIKTFLDNKRTGP